MFFKRRERGVSKNVAMIFFIFKNVNGRSGSEKNTSFKLRNKGVKEVYEKVYVSLRGTSKSKGVATLQNPLGFKI